MNQKDMQTPHGKGSQLGFEPACEAKVLTTVPTQQPERVFQSPVLPKTKETTLIFVQKKKIN